MIGLRDTTGSLTDHTSGSERALPVENFVLLAISFLDAFANNTNMTGRGSYETSLLPEWKFYTPAR